jgi:hypothetical protein
VKDFVPATIASLDIIGEAAQAASTPTSPSSTPTMSSMPGMDDGSTSSAGSSDDQSDIPAAVGSDTSTASPYHQYLSKLEAFIQKLWGELACICPSPTLVEITDSSSKQTLASRFIKTYRRLDKPTETSL